MTQFDDGLKITLRRLARDVYCSKNARGMRVGMPQVVMLTADAERILQALGVDWRTAYDDAAWRESTKDGNDD